MKHRLFFGLLVFTLLVPAVISAAPVWTDADNALLSEFLSEADPVKRRALIEKHRARLTEAWQDAALERARSLASRGQANLGIRITERVEEIARATIGEQQAAWTIFQRGDIHFYNRSDNAAALAAYETARAIYQKVGDVLGEANCIRSLGNIALYTSDNEGARRRFEEAAGKYASIDDRHSLYNAARDLARALLRLHRLPEARAALDRALSAALYTRAQAGAGSDRLRYQESIGAGMKDAVLEFAGKDAVFALSIWERFRGRSFLEGLSGRQALEASGVSEADRKRWQELQAAEASARQALAGIARGGAGDLAAARARVERAERALEDFEGELAKKHPRFAELRRPTIPEVLQLQKSLARDEAALVFLLSEAGAGVWVVKRKSLRFQTLEGTDAHIADRIAGLRRHIEREGQTRGVAVKVHSTVSDTREGFSVLGAQLFGRLGADLKGVGRVLIVSDGSLGVLPFAGLLVNGQPLAEQYRVSFAPSLATAAKLRARDFAHRRRLPLVAFGAAESKPQDPAARAAALAVILERGYREGSWTDLPGARAEARAVGALYYRRESDRRAGLFEGIHASEPALKSFNRGRGRVSLGRARVLHFALHGKAEADFPETSRIILSQPGVIPEKERAELGRAYPDFPNEDGSLLAAEIVGLRLHADLVVLSACETGLGKATSTEGVVGLTQAWMIAGANGVVVSLWQVSDIGTRVFMTEFHGRVAKGVPAAALEEARRALQNGTWRRGEFAPEKEIGDGSGRRFRELDLSSAYYWAAFQYWGK